jgi:CBS domain containing-hemolysin-like protein
MRRPHAPLRTLPSADEISIITGALDLTSKTAWAAMTPLDKVRFLPFDTRGKVIKVQLFTNYGVCPGMRKCAEHECS